MQPTEGPAWSHRWSEEHHLQQRLGTAQNNLAARLELFVAEGLMTVSPAPTGHGEYHLTEKGLDFKPVIIALTEWGTGGPHPKGLRSATSTTNAAVTSARS